MIGKNLGKTNHKNDPQPVVNPPVVEPVVQPVQPVEVPIEPPVTPTVRPAAVPITEEIISPQTIFQNNIIFMRAFWNGLYGGLYAKQVKGMVPKPTSECLGSWMLEDIRYLKTFKHNI